jgi:predicted RNase H-like nuclease (RuvC/YqgF family)
MEIAIAFQVPKDITLQVEELLESFRVENGELSAQLEEKNRIIMDLETKLKKTENKYFSTAWKLSSTKREISNPLKKRFPNLRNTITLNEPTLLEKEKAFKSSSKARNLNFAGEYEYLCVNSE